MCGMSQVPRLNYIKRSHMGLQLLKLGTRRKDFGNLHAIIALNPRKEFLWDP